MSGPEKMSGVLSPVVTPFKKDLSVDAGRLVRQCRWIKDASGEATDDPSVLFADPAGN